MHCDWELVEAEPLRGSIDVRVRSKGSSDGQIVEVDADWHVDIEWRLLGSLVHHFCGSFLVGLFLEVIGPGDDHSIGTNKIPIDPCSDGIYRTSFLIPAGLISVTDSGGMFRLIATLTSQDCCDQPGMLATFCEGQVFCVSSGGSP